LILILAVVSKKFTVKTYSTGLVATGKQYETNSTSNSPFWYKTDLISFNDYELESLMTIENDLQNGNATKALETANSALNSNALDYKNNTGIKYNVKVFEGIQSILKPFSVDPNLNLTETDKVNIFRDIQLLLFKPGYNIHETGRTLGIIIYANLNLLIAFHRFASAAFSQNGFMRSFVDIGFYAVDSLIGYSMFVLMGLLAFIMLPGILQMKLLFNDAFSQTANMGKIAKAMKEAKVRQHACMGFCR
jgi:hypothetical protein